MLKTALVTGGAGFIGSNLVKRLQDEQHEVCVVDDLSNGHVEFVPTDVEFWGRDFSDPYILSRVCLGEFDTIFHLAARPRVSYSVEHPFDTNDVNVTKTLKLLEAAAPPNGTPRVERFIFASSSSVYGGADVLPTPHTYPRDPKSPYALQKAIIEDYLKMWNHLYGLDSACLRFFNVFGPNQLGDSPYATAVSAWLTAIYKGESMRSDGDGTQSRDMCYVDNVVDAMMKAAEAPHSLNAACMNVAVCDRISNNEILEFLMQRFPHAKKHDAPWRPGDVMHTMADVSETKRLIGYSPLVPFWDGLEKTIQWYEENWNRIKGMKLNT